jgi:hypothetical protein
MPHRKEGMSNLLSDALERAIPGPTDGPLLPDARERLASGRRSVRRRRLVTGGIVAAVAAAAVVVPTALVNGSAPDQQLPPVADGGTTHHGWPGGATPSPTERANAAIGPFGMIDGEPSTLVRMDLDSSKVHLLDGVTVVERVPDPFTRTGEDAWAATVDYDGTSYWALAHRTYNGSSGTYHRPVPGRSIEQWIRDIEVTNTGRDHRWLDLADDGSVTGRDGAVVLSQHSPAPVEQADPREPSAVAMIEVDGGRACVLTRRVGTGWSEEIVLPETEFLGCADIPGWDYPGNPAS